MASCVLSVDTTTINMWMVSCVFVCGHNYNEHVDGELCFVCGHNYNKHIAFGSYRRR